MSPEPLVLILTHRADHYTVDRVTAALEQRGARVFRFDTDRHPASVRLTTSFGTGDDDTIRDRPPVPHAEIVDGETRIDATAVQAVWTRQIWRPELSEDLDPQHREACARESIAALRGFLRGLSNARWINPLDTIYAAADKMAQLRVACEVGLAIPPTLVTNDADRARAFFRRCSGRMIAKLLEPLAVGMEPQAAFFHTTDVREEDLADAAMLRHAPMIFQRKIEKDVEFRVTCIGKRLYTAAIDASASEHGATDWRRSSPDECGFERAELPDSVAERVRELLLRLGLVYGAVDMIRTPQGEHVFLEVNPTGEWGMIERDLGYPISETLADALLSEEPVRGGRS